MEQSRSVYHTGANDGLMMGIYLSCIFLLQSAGSKYLILSMSGNLMMLCTPILAYIMLRRGYQASGKTWTFSAIWLHGIVTFMCGSLILALVMYMYMRILQPTFIYEQIKTIIEAYESIGTDEALQMAGIFQRMIDKHLLPSPISLTFSMIWLVSFCGAILSMLIAIILKIRKK